MPRLTSPTTSRPFYYDRNPINTVREFNARAVLPHAETERWTYTVPADKKAFLENGVADTILASAASSGGLRLCAITMDTDQNAALIVVTGEILPEQNTIADRDKNVFTGAMMAVAGEIIAGISVDVATDGTVNYRCVSKITEYDA